MRLTSLVFASILAACSGSKAPPTGPGSATPTEKAGACIKTGCSATICAEAGNDQMSTCEFKPEYACYQKAACEKQSDGKCGWTQSDELKGCLANPPKS